MTSSAESASLMREVVSQGRRVCLLICISHNGNGKRVLQQNLAGDPSQTDRTAFDLNGRSENNTGF